MRSTFFDITLSPKYTNSQTGYSIFTVEGCLIFVAPSVNLAHFFCTLPSSESEKSETSCFSITGQCRTSPWPAVLDWTRMPECRCQTEAADYWKKCQCWTNFFTAIRHSDIYNRCLLALLITWLFSKKHLNGLPCQ